MRKNLATKEKNSDIWRGVKKSARTPGEVKKAPETKAIIALTLAVAQGVRRMMLTKANSAGVQKNPLQIQIQNRAILTKIKMPQILRIRFSRDMKLQI